MAMKISSVMLVVFSFVALMAMNVPKAQAQTGVGINLAVITGNVSCSLNGSSSAPPFPNATVQLQCGGLTVATTVTNNSGTFTFRISIPRLLSIIRDLLTGNCKVVVITPLVACNATLPSTGSLVAPIVSTGVGLIGSILALLFGILQFVFTI